MYLSYVLDLLGSKSIYRVKKKFEQLPANPSICFSPDMGWNFKENTVYVVGCGEGCGYQKQFLFYQIYIGLVLAKFEVKLYFCSIYFFRNSNNLPTLQWKQLLSIWKSKIQLSWEKILWFSVISILSQKSTNAHIYVWNSNCSDFSFENSFKTRGCNAIYAKYSRSVASSPSIPKCIHAYQRTRLYTQTKKKLKMSKK